MGGAILLGTIIVLGALTLNRNSEAQIPGEIIAVETPNRTYIESKDSDGDGVADWEGNLQEIFVNTVSTSTLLAQASSTEPYEPPTTFTGKFSEAFFKDYLDGKIKGQDYSDPTAFVNTAVEAIEKNTESKRYTRLDFTTVPATDEGLHAYGNRVGEINIMHAQTSGKEDAAQILKEALEKKDSKILEKLEPLRAGYSSIISDLLQMEVPDELADTHVTLLNAYEAMLTNTEAMRIAFDDPLYALARVKTYQEDALSLYGAFKAVNLLFREKNIQFTSDEQGAFFYLFDV